MSFRDSISDRPATIKVGRGPHAGVFTVPKALLCNSSTYFKTALNSQFIEGQTQTVNLEDEDPAIFRTYIAWLYQGQLKSQDIEGALDDPQSFDQHIAELILQNDGISMLLSYMDKNGLATLNAINCIYNLPRSKEIRELRCLLAEEEMRYGRRLEKNIDGWHPEYLAQIVKAYKAIHERQIPQTRMPGSVHLDRAYFCQRVHMHDHQAQPCSSLAKNTYVPAPPPTQEPPNKKQRTRPTSLFVLDD
ncbi:unnamed protein product [Aureobasidium mustum]|uniref:BTB domain-containing protein n=1 Tax=Aureobasidium mustum TaxID=2773714 RepID=A0A9N8JP51_9PEZI|nr:unnamed protein product [Aureobasidium mustum]